MEQVIKGVWPFMIAQLVVLFLMVLFPGTGDDPGKVVGGWIYVASIRRRGATMGRRCSGRQRASLHPA